MKNMFLLAGAAAILSQPAAAQVMPLDEAATAFGSRQTHWAADLSPSGDRMLALGALDGSATVVMMYDLTNGGEKILVSSKGEDEEIDWCRFASEQSVICQFSGETEYSGTLIDWGRLAVVSVEDGELRMLGQRKSFYDAGLRQFDGRILDWLPDEDAILMAREYVPEVGKMNTRLVRKEEGLGVDHIELDDLKTKSVESPNKSVDGYLSDGQGDVRIRVNRESGSRDGNLTGIVRFYYRTADSSSWKELSTYNSIDESGFYPLAVERQSDSVYGLEQLDGRDALYRISLNGSLRKELVAKNDRVDIDGVVRLGRGLPVIGYNYADERSHIVYFDDTYEKLSGSLSKALPDAPLIHYRGASSDGNRLLLSAGSDAQPGELFLLNRETRELSPLLKLRPQFQDRSLATVEPFTYEARDGATIPAYLTKPKGVTGPTGLVVLPHGGPSARDTWGFDWLAQFFAARGYAVVQPNYRGSAGYGQSFRNGNGFQGWRTAVNDIEDAARHLIDNGTVDPDRVAIAGWSYGGYAALLGAAEAPDLYKAVISIAPVTDLRQLVDDARGFTNEDLVREMVGKGDQTTAGSPLRRIDDITVPVLLVHGDKDTNVTIRHSDLLEDALDDAGKPVEYLRYPNLDHQLSNNHARIEMLRKAGALLDRTIGN